MSTQAALRGVVLESLGNVQSDISEAQLTVGSAKVTDLQLKSPNTRDFSVCQIHHSSDSNHVQHAHLLQSGNGQEVG